MPYTAIAQNTAAWLEARHGKLTASQAAKTIIQPYISSFLDLQAELAELEAVAEPTKTQERRMQTIRGKLPGEEARHWARKTPAGFWKYLAERVTAWEENPEPPMARGHRLEPKNVQLTLSKLDLPGEPKVEPGIWTHPTMPTFQVSPDCIQDADNPTWAIECKSLSSAAHLEIYCKLQLLDAAPSLPAFRALQIQDITSSFELIPVDYQAQILHYFLCIPSLETVYFACYDDRLPAPADHFIITIVRDDVRDQLGIHSIAVRETCALADQLLDTIDLLNVY